MSIYSITDGEKVVLVRGPSTCKEALELARTVREVPRSAGTRGWTTTQITEEQYLRAHKHRDALKVSGNNLYYEPIPRPTPVDRVKMVRY